MGARLATVVGLLFGCVGGVVHAEPGELMVTFYSEPAAASLYSHAGGLQGVMPLQLRYRLPEPWRECLPLEPLTARWASGATAQITVAACPAQGPQQHHVVRHPEPVPAELDDWFAGKVQALDLVDVPPGVARDSRLAALLGTGRVHVVRDSGEPR